MNKLQAAVLALGLVLAAAPASATVTFDYIFDGGFPLSVSNDGSVIAGNLANGSFGPYRWTQATGLVDLGRHTWGGGAGLTVMSADGTKIAATIGSLDSTYNTQGLWTLGSGWQELSPYPADGGIIDMNYGSIWSLSGDGTTPVGLYWRSGVGNRAHASKWTQATGVVDLGGTITGQASRANTVNGNGSVIAGWVETPQGPWRPAVWDNGTCVLLTSYDPLVYGGAGEARCMNAAGTIIAGFSADPVTHQRAAAMWKKTGGVWGATQILGWLDGSEPEHGINMVNAISSDGSIAIGYTSYAGDPFDVASFIWTQNTGLVDIRTYLADNGVFVDPNFYFKGMYAMTPDGTKLYGYGEMLTAPYAKKAFRITLPGLLAVHPETATPRLSLSAPLPNPSSSATRLEFELAQATSADLTIFDAAGRRVATLVRGAQPAGKRAVTWNGQDADGRPVAAGIYFARLSTPLGATSRRIVRVN
jgi:uncharacterized membrane protein